MRSAILASFLSLWIISIVIPSVVAIVDHGQESAWVFNHTEEEQESGEKDKFEEKIFSDNHRSISTSNVSEQKIPINILSYLNSSHVKEILLPPPERI